MEQQQQQEVETTSNSYSSSCFSSSTRSNENNMENNGKPLALSSKFPSTFWEMAGASSVILGLIVCLVGVYISLPDSDYSFLNSPRTLEDLRVFKDNRERYRVDYTIQENVFMSLLAGSLFGVLKSLALVVFAATAGASSCYFLSNLIGRPLFLSFWPDKLAFFQNQVAKRQSRLLNYMIFLRVTPTLPSSFINVASPLVNVPYHTFVLLTSLGIIPVAFVSFRAGMALGELQSIGDLAI